MLQFFLFIVAAVLDAQSPTEYLFADTKAFSYLQEQSRYNVADLYKWQITI